MSVGLLETLFQLDKYGWPAHEEIRRRAAAAVVDDLWSSINHARKAAEPALADAPPPPYVHPSVRRSMSPNSLLICTESLGSETGSDYFSSSMTLHSMDMDSNTRKTDGEKEEADSVEMTRENKFVPAEAEEYCQPPKWKGRGLMSAASYRCSTSRKSAPARPFPPPLTSISRRDGRPSLHMRPHRRDGRLVVEAVSTPSKNYLHALRENGRLLLSFNDGASDAVEIEHSQQQNQITEDESDEIEQNSALEEEKEGEEEEEEEEEVEVVDRGTVVEVKVLRSSLVINKFVGGSPVSSNAELEGEDNNQRQAMTDAVSVISRRHSPTAATAAAAVVVASSSSFGASGSEQYNSSSRGGGERAAPESEEEDCHLLLEEKKLLFTSKRRNREEMLQSMRGCSELRKTPLFIWEPCCVATSY